MVVALYTGLQPPISPSKKDRKYGVFFILRPEMKSTGPNYPSCTI